MGKHAVLAASAAKRWMACPPSARLEETLPEATSPYAEEGTLAHAVGESYLRQMLAAEHQEAALSIVDDLYPGLPKEIDDCAQTYSRYVRDEVFRGRANAFIERHVNLTNYVPAGFGTLDAGAVDEESLDIADYKHGKGVFVSVENNPQFMIYALGLYDLYGFIYSPKVVRMHVIQPRLDNIASWEISADELLDWGENVLRPAAQLAYMGAGEFNPGDHCQFCRAKAICRARAENFTALEDFEERTPPLLTDAEIGEILGKLKPLESWAKHVREYSLTSCLTGAGIPGWKAVAGRSIRAFSDASEAFKRLQDSGVPESMLYDRKPRTLATLEKDVGKAQFAEILGDLIVKPEGKPTLAPEGDKREAVRNESARDDFAEEYEE